MSLRPIAVLCLLAGPALADEAPLISTPAGPLREVKGSAIPDWMVWRNNLRTVARGSKILDVLRLDVVDRETLEIAGRAQTGRDAACQSRWEAHAAEWNAKALPSPDPFAPLAFADPEAQRAEQAARAKIDATCQEENGDAAAALLAAVSPGGAATLTSWAEVARAGTTVYVPATAASVGNCMALSQVHYMFQIPGEGASFTAAWAEREFAACACWTFVHNTSWQDRPLPWLCDGDEDDDDPPGTGGFDNRQYGTPGVPMELRAGGEWTCAPLPRPSLARTFSRSWLAAIAGGPGADPRCTRNYYVNFPDGTTDTERVVPIF